MPCRHPDDSSYSHRTICFLEQCFHQFGQKLTFYSQSLSKSKYDNHRNNYHSYLIVAVCTIRAYRIDASAIFDACYYAQPLTPAGWHIVAEWTTNPEPSTIKGWLTLLTRVHQVCCTVEYVKVQRFEISMTDIQQTYHRSKPSEMIPNGPSTGCRNRNPYLDHSILVIPELNSNMPYIQL